LSPSLGSVDPHGLSSFEITSSHNNTRRTQENPIKIMGHTQIRNRCNFWFAAFSADIFWLNFLTDNIFPQTNHHHTKRHKDFPDSTTLPVPSPVRATLDHDNNIKPTEKQQGRLSTVHHLKTTIASIEIQISAESTQTPKRSTQIRIVYTQQPGAHNVFQKI